MNVSADPEETMLFFKNPVNGMLQDCQKKSTTLSHGA